MKSALEELISAVPLGQRQQRSFETPFGQLVFTIIRGAEPGPTVWLQAAEHGDELDGIYALHQLVATLSPAKVHGTIVALPIANPSAFAVGHNRSPRDNVNLNRVFTKAAHPDSYSYRYGRYLAELIARVASCFIDLHGGGEYLDVASFVTIPETATPATQQLVTEFLDVEAVLTGNKQSSAMLIDELTASGVAAILLESGGASQVTDRAIQIHIDNVLQSLRYWGVLATALTQQQTHPRIIHRIQEGTFATLGLLQECRQPGDVVVRGEPVVTYSNIAQQSYQLVVSLKRAIVLSVHTQSLVRPGQYAFLLGQID